MKRLFSYRPLSTDLGIFLLRLIFGGLFIWHGVDALMHYQQYLGYSIVQKPKGTIGFGAEFEFALVVYSQFICGILITIGLLTRAATIPIAIMMGVAFFIAHDGQKFFEKELPFVYMLLCIAIFIFGSGRFSVDRLIFKR